MLRGFFFCLSIHKWDFDTKKTTPKMEFCPESLGAMLEYWYITSIVAYHDCLYLLANKDFNLLLVAWIKQCFHDNSHLEKLTYNTTQGRCLLSNFRSGISVKLSVSCWRLYHYFKICSMVFLSSHARQCVLFFVKAISLCLISKN